MERSTQNVARARVPSGQTEQRLKSAVRRCRCSQRAGGLVLEPRLARRRVLPLQHVHHRSADHHEEHLQVHHHGDALPARSLLESLDDASQRSAAVGWLTEAERRRASMTSFSCGPIVPTCAAPAFVRDLIESRAAERQRSGVLRLREGNESSAQAEARALDKLHAHKRSKPCGCSP